MSFYVDGFPHRAIEALFSRHKSIDKREFAIEAGDENDRYMKRYVSGGVLAPEMARHKTLKTLHVGPIWSGRPEKPHSITYEGLVACSHDLDSSRPSMKELVFDLDLTDYPFGIARSDQQRNDCFWSVVGLGTAVLVELMRECFDLVEAVPVYSGRRGAHLWVLDHRAMQMTDGDRAALVAFLQPPIAKGGRVGFETLAGRSPCFEELYEKHVAPFWRNRALKPAAEGGLGLFDDFETLERFVELLELHSTSLDTLAFDAFERPNGVARFDYVVSAVADLARQPKLAWATVRVRDAVATFLWPRLDAAVTAKMNHLAKCPFSLHPKTGRVAVSLRVDELLTFDPVQVPVVGDTTFGAFVADRACELNAAVASFGPVRLYVRPGDNWAPPAQPPEAEPWWAAGKNPAKRFRRQPKGIAVVARRVFQVKVEADIFHVESILELQRTNQVVNFDIERHPPPSDRTPALELAQKLCGAMVPSIAGRGWLVVAKETVLLLFPESLGRQEALERATRIVELSCAKPTVLLHSVTLCAATQKLLALRIEKFR